MIKKNLGILNFLENEFTSGKITKLHSIVFNIDKKYPSQVSSHSIVINFDSTSIKLEPFGNYTYQPLKIGYSLQTVDGVCENYKNFSSNELVLNLNIIRFEYVYKPQVSTLIIVCEDGLKHEFYCADYNTEMCGAFKSENNQNLYMTEINKRIKNDNKR